MSTNHIKLNQNRLTVSTFECGEVGGGGGAEHGHPESRLFPFREGSKLKRDKHACFHSALLLFTLLLVGRCTVW